MKRYLLVPLLLVLGVCRADDPARCLRARSRPTPG